MKKDLSSISYLKKNNIPCIPTFFQALPKYSG